MDCENVKDKVELLLDGELTENEKQTVIQHIEKCDCEAKSRYERERCFREHVQNMLTRKQVSSNIVKDVRNYVIGPA
jgi:predicted anti-sigma-YlaC factor YlaD